MVGDGWSRDVQNSTVFVRTLMFVTNHTATSRLRNSEVIMTRTDRVMRMPTANGRGAARDNLQAERQLFVSLWLITALVGATALMTIVSLVS